MSHHEITASDDGFEVSRVERTVLGAFLRKADAELFRDALVARDRKPEPFTRCLTNPTAEPGPPEANRAQSMAAAPADIGSEPELERKLETPVDPAPAASSSDDGPTAKSHPALFAQAEARLVDGDDLKQVATAFGIPMTRLRGWWASRRKGAAGSAPADVARRAPAGLTDEAEDELLTICRADDPEEDLARFATRHGKTPAECRKLADKLLSRGA